MKLDVAVNEVVLSNVGATGEFKIRNSAKAFKILSDGLYSNKIRAIIRELSCNAVDSHVAAGRATVPFEVHLPTMLEPWFSVRDFGTGLTGDQVQNIYTTYFESTKTDSNDFIGALGLGSKSPFSYTENFTVTAIRDGTRRIYSAFINENGVPSIVEMSVELTDEANGVEVKFSVTDRYDYQTFVHEAQYVFKWFTNKPTVTGHSFTHHSPAFKERNIVPGVHSMGEHLYNSLALMGNIVYPIKVPQADKHFGSLATLLDCDLTLEFGIGELDFAASREELSYVPLTIKSILTKLEALNDNLATHFATKANAIECEWSRAFLMYSESNEKLYSSAVKKYAADTKFALYDPHQYHGNKTFDYKITDLEARGLSIQGMRFRHGSSSKHHNEYVNVNGAHVPGIRIPVQSDVVIVLNDLKTGCASRARYHFNQSSAYQTVYCVSHNDADLSVRQAEYDKLIAELHNPPTVVMASSLQKQERKKPTSSVGIARLALRENTRAGYTESYGWTAHNEPIDENETYYFVYLNGHKPIDAEGKPFDINGIKARMDESGVPGLSSTVIYGVRKSRMKEISELDNWVWVEDKIKEVVSKITDKDVASLIVADTVDQYSNRTYNNKDVAKRAPQKSLYATFYNKYGTIKRTTGNTSMLVSLCAEYGKTVQVEKVRTAINDEQNALHTRYPMLRYINNHAPDDLILNYVELIEKS